MTSTAVATYDQMLNKQINEWEQLCNADTYTVCSCGLGCDVPLPDFIYNRSTIEPKYKAFGCVNSIDDSDIFEIDGDKYIVNEYLFDGMDAKFNVTLSYKKYQRTKKLTIWKYSIESIQSMDELADDMYSIRSGYCQNSMYRVVGKGYSKNITGFVCKVTQHY